MKCRRGILADAIERQNRVAQMIEHPHEQHDVERAIEAIHLVDRELAKLDRHVLERGSEGGLGEMAGIGIDADDPAGTAALISSA